MTCAPVSNNSGERARTFVLAARFTATRAAAQDHVTGRFALRREVVVNLQYADITGCPAGDKSIRVLALTFAAAVTSVAAGESSESGRGAGHAFTDDGDTPYHRFSGMTHGASSGAPLEYRDDRDRPIARHLKASLLFLM